MTDIVVLNGGNEEDSGWSYEQCTPDPNGLWEIDEDGLYFTKITSNNVNRIKVASQPIYVKDKAIDLDTDQVIITVVWEDGGSVRRYSAPSKKFASSHGVMDLADMGYPINSRNSRYIVEYLEHLLDYHKSDIPVRYMVSSCGTKAIDSKTVFMVGNHAISGEENAPDVSFNPYSNAYSVVSNMDSPTGACLKSWVDTAREVGEYPLAAFGVMASFLAPLLNDLGACQNIIIDYGGKTSGGKSTTLRFAASVWGSPREGSGLIRSWSGTQTFFERYAAVWNEMPIFLDESHMASANEVSKTLYQYSNGTGRGRGTRGGMQSSASYCGVLLSAGEARLVDIIKLGGVHARVIGFSGSPYGAGQKKLVDRINQTASKHYGLAGIAVLQEYMRNRQELLPQLKAAQDEMTESLAAKVDDNIAQRLAGYFSAIYAAGVLADYVLDLQWDVKRIVNEAFVHAVGNRPPSVAQEAIELVGEWMAANPSKFQGTSSENLPDELFGRVFQDKETGEQRLAILPQVLQSLIRQNDFPYATVMQQWLDNGWLDTDPGRQKKRVRFNGSLVYMVVFNEIGIAAANGGASDQDDADADIQQAEL